MNQMTAGSRQGRYVRERPRRGARTALAGFALAASFLVAFAALPAGAAQASTASLVNLDGIPTLGLVAAGGEMNSVDLALEPGGKWFTLKDNGSRRGQVGIDMKLDPGSMAGCELVVPGIEFSYDHVRCRTGKVERIVAKLGDRDDWFANGEPFSNRGQVPVPVFVDGGKGNDQLLGGMKNDSLAGGPGNDVIEGRKGKDMVSGGAGADSVAGDERYTLDRPPGRGGNDRIAGGAGRDIIYPGSGRDTVKAGSGRDTVTSVIDRDRDYVDCGSGPDSLIGVNSRGIRFAEKAVLRCETVSNGMFGGLVWSCRKRRCKVTVKPFSRVRATRSRPQADG